MGHKKAPGGPQDRPQDGAPAVKMAAPVLDSRGAPLGALLEPSWGLLGALGGPPKGPRKIPGGPQERPQDDGGPRP
eukprot:9486758-Pyramimonas_sp.AAC.1